jgi:hypothetical protein
VLYLYCNFHLECRGRRVNEYQDVLTNGIEEGSVLDVVLGTHIYM